MALDPMIFKQAAASTRIALAENRLSQSDSLESKANIIAERIVNGRFEDDELDSTNEVDSYDFQIPSRENSGLIDSNIIPDESQVAAVNMLIQEQYGCMIGAAGSGKTTTQKLFLEKMIFGDDEFGVEPMTVKKLGGKQGLNIALCAFTGIATQVIKSNMPPWLHASCKTIHSLLEYAPVTTEIIDKKTGEPRESRVFMPMRHAANKLDHEIVVIDEASMVGLDLWHQLMDALRPGTKVFLVGDLNQLPPTASQSIFAYALSVWPVAELTHIHRQKEPAANKIIEVAHSILQGKQFELDDPRTNHNWRVIGYEVDNDPQKAGIQVVNICNQLRDKRVHSSVDPEKSLIYDPYRDRIITAGNGYDENDARAAVQQYVINEALSQLIEPPTEEHPRFIIDAGISRKKFAVNHRVMATKNEPPSVEDRVTNGMVGVITFIEKHPGWSGNHALVGPEHIVLENKKAQLDSFFSSMQDGSPKGVDFSKIDDEMDSFDPEELDFSAHGNNGKSKEGGGPASHKVTVRFANGAVRVFSNKTSVDSLMLAYASTCHKCQGSQFETAIIVIHHSWKSQLCREWLYTAVTRAQKRVILLYTKHGVRLSLGKQKIFGSTLAQKIQKYKQLTEESTGPVKTRVRLYIEE